MGLLDPFFKKKTFSLKTDDAQMRAASTWACTPCNCLEPQYEKKQFTELKLHTDVQDTNGEAWASLLKLIQNARHTGSRKFAPGLEMPPELWSQIITLPPVIGTLTSVTHLYLYGSNLVRIPPEIGQMSNLGELDVYTSYRLHWLPYEVTRCKKLSRSRFSTRALYGNYKHRPPFPRIGGETPETRTLSKTCSVCDRDYAPEFVLQRWISLNVGTDVLPLLVNACSEECLGRLPAPARGYVDRPHSGGLEVQQPATQFGPPARSG